jgi:hypothetical protein
MTGKGSFPVEWAFASEIDICWADAEPDNNSLQDCPGRAFGGNARDISL